MADGSEGLRPRDPAGQTRIVQSRPLNVIILINMYVYIDDLLVCLIVCLLFIYIYLFIHLCIYLFGCLFICVVFVCQHSEFVCFLCIFIYKYICVLHYYVFIIHLFLVVSSGPSAARRGAVFRQLTTDC